MRPSARLATAAVMAIGSCTLLAAGGRATATSGADLPEDPDAQILNLDRGHVVVYADGRVFRRAEDPWRVHSFRASSPRMAPPPAPSGYETAQLTDDGLALLWQRAGELGMFEDEPDYGDPRITDTATSQLAVTTGDQIFEHFVYAPGEEVGDDEAQERRDHYAEFAVSLVEVDRVLVDEISKFEPWVPDAWVVSDRAWWYEEPDRDWPLDKPPTPGACVVLPTEGDEDTATGGYAISDGDIVVVDAALPGTDCAAGNEPTTTWTTRRPSCVD